VPGTTTPTTGPALHEQVQITKNGREYVVFAVADLEWIEATLELLAEPDAEDRLRAAGVDVAAGEVLDGRAVRDLGSGHHRQSSRCVPGRRGPERGAVPG